MAKEKIIVKRGDVYLVNFDPTMGAEIKKTRPALILQNDIANTYSPVTIVAAITSKFDTPIYPTEVLLEKEKTFLKNDSVVLLNQIRSIDKKRLVRRLGSAGEETMDGVNRALEVSLDIGKI